MPAWRKPVVFDLALFLTVGIGIVIATWPTIRVDNVEIGDFAANSILIQDAKHLGLFKGNYSRIGVNHPGPAILYVLALGELLFHDLLHLTKSAFSGQLVAGCLYTAGWTAVVGSEFRKISRSAAVALPAVAVFLLAMACFNYNFFSDIWFPNLYVFPFAAMTIALARLIDGHADSLIPLAVAAGFLFDGHVSFAPMLVVVLVVAVLGNALLYRRVPARLVAGALFLRTHRRRVLVAAGLFLLFVAPLAIETLVSWPGPIKGYLSFGSEQEPHTVREAILFLSVYWGGLAPLVGGVAGLALAVAATRFDGAFGESIRAIAFASIAASAALFVYARYGVDFVEFDYLGYFYHSVPCLAAGTMTLIAFKAAGTRFLRVTAIVVTVACLAFTFSKVQRPVRDLDQYNVPALSGLYAPIKAAAVDGRLVLDLDNQHDWGHLWTHLVGVQAYAQRRGENLFCINRNWHVLFTPSARCTPDELETRPRYLMRTMTKDKPWNHPVAFEALGLQFSPYTREDITDAGYISVVAKPILFDDSLLESGWSPAEAEYVWSTAAEAHLSVRVRPDFSGNIALDLGSFITPTHPRIDVSALVDGVPSGNFVFTQQQLRQTLTLPVKARSQKGFVEIVLKIDKPMSPRSARAGNDIRTLGVSLYGLEAKGK